MSKLSPNFRRSEFECKCGCGFDTVDSELLTVAEVIRDRVGAFTPNSGCRCEEYNEIIQKKYNPNYVPFSSKSKHLIGRAIDVPTGNPQELFNFLDKLFPNIYGIGLYRTFVHIDTRSKKARWGSG